MTIINTDKLSFAIRLIKEAFWGYRSKFARMTALGFLAGIFGGIGIGAIIPLFSFLTKENIAETDAISKMVEKVFSFLHIEYNLFFLLVFIVLVFIAKAIVQYLAQHTNQKISAKYERDTRSELFGKTIKADWPHLLEQKIGYLESVLSNDIYTSSGILTSLSGLIMLSTSLIMYALVAFNISFHITLLTFGVGVAVFFFLKPLFFKSRKTAYDLAFVAKQVGHHVNEHMIGAKTVKTMGAEDEIIKTGDEYFENCRKMRVKLDLYNRIPGTFLEPVSILFISAIFSFYYYFGTPLNIVSFAAIVYLIQKEFTFMQSIQSTLNNINQNIPSLKIVADYKKNALGHQEINPGSEPFDLKEKLELRNISFAYGENGKILSGLDLEIKKGEMLGLIGPSGAGKTTLIDILLRLFPPGSGEILLDGRDASNIDLKSWRKNIGYVSQDTFLLNDTLENNIKFYNKNISNNEMIAAAKMANIYDFIIAQQNKFATIVGERGVKLSGGQRQRVALARILAKKPKVLVLDEATSALDNESELLIQKAIEELKGKTTILVIAHRLSTIMNSDRLLVLEKGKIIEEGKPPELLKDKDSYFYKVYNIREK